MLPVKLCCTAQNFAYNDLIHVQYLPVVTYYAELMLNILFLHSHALLSNQWRSQGGQMRCICFPITNLSLQKSPQAYQ